MSEQTESGSVNVSLPVGPRNVAAYCGSCGTEFISALEWREHRDDNGHCPNPTPAPIVEENPSE